MVDIDTVAEQIRELRKGMKESQTVFAAGCNISVEEISLIERRRADPRLSTLRKISEHAGVSVSDLVKSKEPACIYCVKSRTVRDERGYAHECYDIECREEKSRELVECVPAVFTSFKEALDFACCLNRNKLSHRHFRDVVEDYLAH